MSQGLLGPLTWISDKTYDISTAQIGDDVTKLLNVRKYVQHTEMDLYSENCKRIPGNIPKTDEDRVQNQSKVLSKLPGQNVIITRKEDRTSATYIYTAQYFLICGRNFDIQSA